MLSVKDKIVFITGASSGIGLACAERFAADGAQVLLAARRIEKLKTIASHLKTKFQATVHCIELDVRKSKQVAATLESLPNEWQQIDILINNAGLALGSEKIQEGKIEDWETMIDTNLKGLLYITQYVVKKMLKRNKGHIINLGSISGHQVYSGGVVYCASKYAVRAISEGLKMDLHGTPIRVTSIDPGMVETEFSLVRFSGDTERAASIYKGVKPLTAEDVADTILYCATRPLHVDIREVILTATAQTTVQMVHREYE